jgi:hypothetical protein
MDNEGYLPLHRALVSNQVYQYESEHPHGDSLDIYTNIQIPGTAFYSITFDKQTSLENNYDYITIFKDDSHTEFWGDRKYTGGRSGTKKYYPGINEENKPLQIPAEKFVLYFHGIFIKLFLPNQSF